MMKNNKLILIFAVLVFVFMITLLPFAVSETNSCEKSADCGEHAWCYTVTNTCHCIGNYMNCDNEWSTGCEVYSSDSNCGGCGIVCGGTGINAMYCDNNMNPPTCMCVNSEFENADGNLNNGCEDYNPPCYDSDGGKDYAEKGTTTKGGTTGTDSCEPNNVLREWYCDENDEVVSELHACGAGYVCDCGICKKESTDPDPDKPPDEGETNCGGTKPASTGVEFGAATYPSENLPSKTYWNYVAEKPKKSNGEEFLYPCQWTCKEGYTRSGNGCTPDSTEETCGGTTPSGAGVLLGSATYASDSAPANTDWNYVTSTPLLACQWTCANGYIRNGNTCKAESTEEDCGGTTPSGAGVLLGSATYVSGSAPANTDWNYVTSTPLLACQWTCEEGYTPDPQGNPSRCVEEEEDCTPIDCEGLKRECGSDGCSDFCQPNDCQTDGYSCKTEIGRCYAEGCGFVDYTIHDPETCDFTEYDGRYIYDHPEDVLCIRQNNVYGALKKCDILKCNTNDSFCEHNTALGIANSLDSAERVCLQGQEGVSNICDGIGAPNCKEPRKDVIYYAPSVFMNTTAQRTIYFADGKNYEKLSNELKTYVSDDFLKSFTEFVMEQTGSTTTQKFYDKFGFIPQDLFDDVLFTHCAYRGFWGQIDNCDGTGPNDVHIYTVCPKIKDKTGNEYDICAFSLGNKPFSATTQNPRCTAVIRTGKTKLKPVTAFAGPDDYCSEGDDSKIEIDWYSIAEGSICGYDDETVSICVEGNCVVNPPSCGGNGLQTRYGEQCDYNENDELVYISTLTADRLCEKNNIFLDDELEDWASGEITCNTETCRLNFSDCKTHANLCGDGILQDWEECDGSLFGEDDTCEKRDPKYSGGTLSCNADCTLNSSACIAKPEKEKGSFCFDEKNNDDYYDDDDNCLDKKVATCTDCQDKDCDKEKLGNEKCEFQTEISCMDSFDNDGDGKADGEDSDDCLELYDWNENKGYCSVYYRDSLGNNPCYTLTECVKHGTQRDDYVCNDGTWISKKLLAVNDLLTNFGVTASSYILHCGTPSEVFNRIGYTTEDFKNVQGMLSSCVDFACAFKSGSESAVLLSIKDGCKPSGTTWALEDYFPSYIFTKTVPDTKWYEGNGYKLATSVGSGFNLLLNPSSNFLIYSTKEQLQSSANTDKAIAEINSINGVANIPEFKSKTFGSFFIYKSGSAKSIGKRLAGSNGFYTAVQFFGMNIDYVCDSLNAKYPDAPICTKSPGSGGYIFSSSPVSGAEVYSKYWPEYSLMVFDTSFT